MPTPLYRQLFSGQAIPENAVFFDDDGRLFPITIIPPQEQNGHPGEIYDPENHHNLAILVPVPEADFLSLADGLADARRTYAGYACAHGWMSGGPLDEMLAAEKALRALGEPASQPRPGEKV